MRDLELMMRDYRLTTAEILYHFPDHPSLLQTYVWQAIDLPPRFPRLTRFLEYWEASLDGKLHSVKIASATTPSAMAFGRSMKPRPATTPAANQRPRHGWRRHGSSRPRQTATNRSR